MRYSLLPGYCFMLQMMASRSGKYVTVPTKCRGWGVGYGRWVEIRIVMMERGEKGRGEYIRSSNARDAREGRGCAVQSVLVLHLSRP
jgi:hypothetical protein